MDGIIKKRSIIPGNTISGYPGGTPLLPSGAATEEDCTGQAGAVIAASGIWIADAIRVALDIAARHDKLHKDPVPIVRFREMADSAVVLQLRAWMDTDTYYPVKSEVLTMLYDDLNAAGIGIPFPQMDVHFKQD